MTSVPHAEHRAWRIADDVVWQVSLDARTVHVMLAPDGDLMVFSGTAAQIWQAIADGLDPVDEMVAQTSSDAPDDDEGDDDEGDDDEGDDDEAEGSVQTDPPRRRGVDSTEVEAGTLGFVEDLISWGLVEQVRPRGGPMTPRPLRVLFLCTANISRSPYAEHRARDLFATLPVEFASAGVPGLEGQPIDSAMGVELRARGIDASSHRSQKMSADLGRSFDLIVCSTARQRRLVIDEWPGLAARTLTFGQLREGLDRRLGDTSPSDDLLADLLRRPVRASARTDVADPHGLGPEAAARCAAEIDDHLRAIIPALVGSETKAARR